jgi:hypothetical protein
MHYFPYQSVGDKPNIIVGGNATSNTVLHLALARDSQTPPALQADLCSEMVFKIFLCDEKFDRAEAVSSDSFNADNLSAIFALTNPELARSLSYELVSIARAALFEKGDDQNIIRIAFVLAAWMDPELSPLNQSVFASPPLAFTNVLYEELLPRLPKIIEKVDYLERYWSRAESSLQQTEDAIASGAIKLTEIKELDLVVVESEREDEVQSLSVHNRTNCSRVLLLGKESHAFYYRCESGIQSTSTVPTAFRIDLTPLAEKLTGYEAQGSLWSFEPIASTKPYLRFRGVKPSQIKKEAFKTALLEVLSNVVN